MTNEAHHGGKPCNLDLLETAECEVSNCQSSLPATNSGTADDVHCRFEILSLDSKLFVLHPETRLT